MDDDDGKREESRQDIPPKHYYGDHVRRLFLGAGALMIAGYPFFRELVNLPVWTALLFMLAISVFAGLQAPRYRWSAFMNVGASTVAFCLFAYRASSFYLSDRYAEAPLFFWANQTLAIIFFFGIYFSVKNTRARL